MLKLEEVRKGVQIVGLDGTGTAMVVSASMVGESVAEVVYRDANGQLGERLIYRGDESKLSIAAAGRAWGFEAPGGEFKLAAEAMRIKLAHLFDPMMAVHTSNVEPLPHQISAVYEAMLPRQPLRYVLADDPGAGKTIMAGLLIRELVMRADARRVLIVSPGSLTGQWQDELRVKFGLEFELFSRERQEASVTGNYFADQDFLICRLDQLARSEDYREKLALTHWDVIIVDEAHKLSASYSGGEVKKTQRFELGEQLGGLCRHLLLMTATPHNGKDEDFQLFLSLLDGDRFYGKFREGVHKVDVSDLMRRMVKEKLLRFDGTPLFPERRAYTAAYELSPAEAALYEGVTTYVREEMDRADKLEGKRKNSVGFALTQLQRRLASSPAAIFESLRRRRVRLESKLEEVRLLERGKRVREEYEFYTPKAIDVPDNIDEAEDELSAEEYEALSEEVVSKASTANTAVEMEAEILILRRLEEQAREVVASGSDSKWKQLSDILQDDPEVKDAAGNRRKLIIFTEHRDTLEYLRRRVSDMLGDQDAVVTIHGGTNRDDRAKMQERFRQSPEVLVLVATDAAGEGVNLQNANLMVNYDLPWNPNRMEQRFGRIHRIGQREVCHLWNLLAKGTREGDVFQRLFEKLETERAALGGQVFDILGEAFENVSLKELLLEAIRYGERPETRAKLNQRIDGALNTEHLKAIIERNALVDNAMSIEHLYAIKEEMDKAEARKLQPYFLRSFFLEAFERVGGQARRREGQRYEVPHVPALLRELDRQISDSRRPLLTRYERICFDKSEIHLSGRRDADLVHPAHPLMASLIDLMQRDLRFRLKQGTVLIDPADEGEEPSLLLMIEHAVREGVGHGARETSRRLQFVCTYEDGRTHFAGWAPHLDFEEPSPSQLKRIQPLLEANWLASGVEARALQYAAEHLAPGHFEEVRQRRERWIDKSHAAVRERLTKEINYLGHRAAELDLEVKAGRQPRVQPEQLRRRMEELAARLQTRERELNDARHLIAATPVVLGGALVVPAGLLAKLAGEPPLHSVDAEARRAIELKAMQAVMAHERSLGHEVKDVSADKCGWDVTAWPPREGDRLPDARHIEVKGRHVDADSVIVTRNEICTALNQGSKFWLAIVRVDGDRIDGPHYIPQPFTQEPEPGATAVTYAIDSLLAKARA